MNRPQHAMQLQWAAHVGLPRRGWMIMELVVAISLLVVGVSMVAMLVVRTHVDRCELREQTVARLVLDNAVSATEAFPSRSDAERQTWEAPAWAMEQLPGAQLACDWQPSEVPSLVRVRMVLSWRSDDPRTSQEMRLTYWWRQREVDDDQ